jgi:hypothetical protein
MVSQDRTGFAVGIVTIQEIRLSGLAPGAVLFRFDLEEETGQRLLARLVQGAPPIRCRANALAVFVQYLKHCQSLDEVRMKCAAPELSHPHPVP